MNAKKISELPSSTVKLITATQIATSVSNIVKELVENSLDAGSTVIRVKLENSGLSKIEVLDNGSGISKENVAVMALPHYTSKISQHQDLNILTTYGFRGEALSAICSVASLSVTTKSASDEVASTSTMDNNGNVIDVKPSHLNQGTSVVVSQLFQNVPVRKQYFQTPKRKREELTKVEDFLLHYGLIHPELHLSFHNDHSLLWQKNRATGFKANIFQTLGHSICSQMEFAEHCDGDENEMKMFLMVPKRTARVDTCFKQKPDRCFTFINERPVISKEILKMMKELYGFAQNPTNKSTLYPIYIVSLQFPGNQVDVNLEPNKTQVLMTRQSEVMELIRKNVSQLITKEALEIPKTTEEGNAKVALPVRKEIDNDEKVKETYQKIFKESVKDPEQYLENTKESVSPDPHRRKMVIPTEFIVANPEQHDNVCLVDSSDPDISFDLFHGFCEPFSVSERNEKSNEIPQEPTPITSIGSEDWSKGIARDSNGRLVHPVEILRGQPHFAKRISEPLPSGNQSKRLKLSETQEAIKIVGPSPRKLETVNGRVKSLPTSSYEEYCKSMKPELLSQNPTMTFTELTQHLSQGWKNLNKKSREQYEEKAEISRQRYKAKISNQRPLNTKRSSLDRFLGSQTPVVRATHSTSLSKASTVSIDFSMERLNESHPQRSSLDQEWSVVTKLENGWLCSKGEDIVAVNFSKLYEVILYFRLVDQQILPSRFAPKPIVINEKILGNSYIWNLLNNLSTEWESTSSKMINDQRIVANGFGIRMCTGASGAVTFAQVFKIPAGINDCDLGDVLKLLERVAEENSTVESCRPDLLKKELKVEATRLATQRFTDPDESELCDLLEQWLSWDVENTCLHGRPIMWHYPISKEDQSNLEEDEKEEEDEEIKEMEEMEEIEASFYLS